MSIKQKSGNPLVDLSAGGIAGCCEALACHPLDTIKVRMQLEGRKTGISRKNIEEAVHKALTNHQIDATNNTIQKVREAAEQQFPIHRRGFVAAGAHIFRKDGFPGLYKGLSVVIAGITPKMAIRFWSFEEFKRLLTPANEKITPPRIFAAGIGAGIMEAIMVVNPTEVIKIRMQTQSHSLSDPTSLRPQYRNAWHCLVTTIRKEGIGAIYRGVGLTAARQATNQGTNFTAYSLIRARANELQPQYQGDLPGWQTSLIGLTSGALGPFSNAPLDVIKTRVQREGSINGESGPTQGLRIARELVRNEGILSLWRGITPRVMRVAPGQAVTFTVYEFARKRLESVFMQPLE